MSFSVILPTLSLPLPLSLSIISLFIQPNISQLNSVIYMHSFSLLSVKICVLSISLSLSLSLFRYRYLSHNRSQVLALSLSLTLSLTFTVNFSPQKKRHPVVNFQKLVSSKTAPRSESSPPLDGIRAQPRLQLHHQTVSTFGPFA